MILDKLPKASSNVTRFDPTCKVAILKGVLGSNIGECINYCLLLNSHFFGPHPLPSGFQSPTLLSAYRRQIRWSGCPWAGSHRIQVAGSAPTCEIV